MPSSLPSLACALACVAPPAFTQTTWTVNASGGAQFTTLLAAVQAANDGDTILVAPGSYATGFTLTKGLAIIGDGGTPQLGGELTVTLPSGRTASLANFTYGLLPFGGFRLSVVNSAGTVHGEALQMWSAYGGGLTAQNSSCVTLTRCSAYGFPAAVVATNASVALASTSLQGASGVGQSSGLEANGSQVALTFCTLTGGDYPLGGDGMRALGSTVRAFASSFLGGIYFGGPRGNSVYLDAASTLRHNGCSFPHGIAGTGPRPLVFMCSLTGTPAQSGGQATFTISGPSGGIAIVAAALPTVPFSSPFGLIWLDPATTYVKRFAALPVAPVVIQIPAGVPRGTAFALQAGLAYGGALEVSPPLVTVVR